MTNKKATDILRNAAWLGTDADRKQIEEAVEMAINALTAQPETHDERTETHSCDCISRQAVIEAINKIFPADPMHDDYTQGITCGAALANIYVAQLPSAQPEIIRCKDCKHWDGVDTCDVIDAPVWDNDFCSFAERRSDEE